MAEVIIIGSDFVVLDHEFLGSLWYSFELCRGTLELVECWEVNAGQVLEISHFIIIIIRIPILFQLRRID